MRGSEWTVVGIFESGDANESELWADVEVAQSAFARQGYSSVRLQLADAKGLQTVKDALTADPRLNVDVQTEEQYYSGQTKQFRQTIGMLAGVVTLIMALGATFAALNTMYAAVGTRAREIATLRAIGFGGFPVVVSIMLESLALALIGGSAGRPDRLPAVQQHGGLDARRQFHADRVPVRRDARARAEGPRHRRRDRHGRRIPAGAPGRAPARDDGAPRRLNRGGGR